jgi:hypothetical protein
VAVNHRFRRIPAEPEPIQQPAHTVQHKQSLIGQATTTDNDVHVENRSGTGTDSSPARTHHASLASNRSHSMSDKAKRKPNALKSVLGRLFRRKTTKDYGESSRSSKQSQSGEWRRSEHHRSVCELVFFSLSLMGHVCIYVKVLTFFFFLGSGCSWDRCHF